MKCLMCKVDKLSNEFPPNKVTASCKHPRLHCMRCVVAHIKQHSICPHPDCSQTISPDSQEVQVIEHRLSEMFREYDSTFTPLVVPEGASQGIIQVTVLNGDSMQLAYRPHMTILQLKTDIQTELKHDVDKQRLLYNATELKVEEAGKPMKLSDYSVSPNSIIHLVILMYAIPEGFDHVVFDLHWGYPLGRCDFLDATCLRFSGQHFVDLIDYGHTYSMDNKQSSVVHSGDVMDSFKKIGHHTINVHLKKIPSNITHLFFTLSAWNSPNISKYPNPSLKFYEADKPNKDLCKTTFNHANYSQAVIMCSVSRTDGCWRIFESGRLSAGNALNYGPIKANIKHLISQGF